MELLLSRHVGFTPIMNQAYVNYIVTEIETMKTQVEKGNTASGLRAIVALSDIGI